MAQQFQVPQFITVEDKILGPLTLKQALIVGAGVGIIIVAKLLFNAFIFVPLAIIVGAATGALAFLKINDQPLTAFVKNALAFYILRPRLYTWTQKKPERTAATSPRKQDGLKIQALPKITESKLSDLAWSLDIKSKEEHTREE